MVLHPPGSPSTTLRGAPLATWAAHRKNPPLLAHLSERRLTFTQVVPVQCPWKGGEPWGLSQSWLLSSAGTRAHGRDQKKKKNDIGPSGRQVVTRGRKKNRGSVACGANWERDCFGAVATALSEKVTLLQRPEGKGESEPRRPPGKSLLEGGAAGRGWGVPRWSGLGPLPPPALAARLRPSSEKKKSVAVQSPGRARLVT